MLNREDIKKRLYGQLARDYNTSAELFCDGGRKVSPVKEIDGRRRFLDHIPSFNLVVTGKSLCIMTESRLMEFSENFVRSSDPAWILEYPKIEEINEELKKIGEHIEDCHFFFLPEPETPEPAHDLRLKADFYHGNEIEQFRGMKEYGEAFAFNERFRDEEAVSASLDGKIVGMAGASRDAEGFYQIGINVSSGYAGKGIGSYLVWLLKNRLLESDIVPFYGTCFSHFASQNVAGRSGFYPAWAEMYSSEIKI
jgi:RimJ/RimL family protein N-acetyltransferase